MRTGGPYQPVHLLLDVVDLLADHRIPYAVVGAFAVSYYGIPRATKDADAIIWPSAGGTTDQDVKKRLAAAGYAVKLRKGDPDDPIGGVIVVKDKHDNRADLLMDIRGNSEL